MGEKASVFAFVWTYPLINMIVVSYTISSHWVYDLMTLIHGNQAPELIRRQMKVFVVAIVIFVIIMYLVYMLSLPSKDTIESLDGVFFYLAVFQWLCSAILLISIFLYVKRIALVNRIYGKAVLMEALVFTFSNLTAGFFNFYLSKDLIGTLLDDRDMGHQTTYSSVIIPYFIISEFIPAISFAYTMKILAKVLSGEIDEEGQQREE